MKAETPNGSCCLGCGYLLRGLAENVCPECGRSFDPADPSTYDPNPTARRKRRRLFVAIGAVAILILGITLAPRRLLSSSVKFKCTRCAETTLVERWELVAPDLLSLRYPGLHWTSNVQNADSSIQPCDRHAYQVNVIAQFPIGSCTGTASVPANQDVVVNGHLATPETGPLVLKQMMSPSNNGIAIGGRALLEKR